MFTNNQACPATTQKSVALHFYKYILRPVPRTGGRFIFIRRCCRRPTVLSSSRYEAGRLLFWRVLSLDSRCMRSRLAGHRHNRSHSSSPVRGGAGTFRTNDVSSRWTSSGASFDRITTLENYRSSLVYKYSTWKQSSSRSRLTDRDSVVGDRMIDRRVRT